MRFLRLIERYSLIIFLCLIVVSISLNIFDAVSFMSFSRMFVDEKVSVSANNLNTMLDDNRGDTRMAAVTMSRDPDLVAAVKAGDRAEIIGMLTQNIGLYRVNFYTVTDGNGVVIARTHDPDKYGDNITSQQNIRSALNGSVTTHYEPGSSALISIRTGAPVYEADGTLIGVVSAGIRFDTDIAVNDIKTLVGAEVTVFVDGLRIASTITQDGQSIIGTEIEPEIAEVVIGEMRELFVQHDTFGIHYEKYYKPLLDNNSEVAAVITLAVPVEDLVGRSNAIIITVILNGIIGVLISLILLNALRNAMAADKVKTAFLANMSHEMRTPLNAVIGLADMCLDDGALSPDTRRNIEQIYNSGSALLVIVNDVLDVSKINTGRIEIAPAEYFVPSLINDILTHNMLRIGDKPVELRHDIDETLYNRLIGDELRVKQIINNIMSNAVKYTDSGYIDLIIHAARGGDTVTLTVTVRDTGAGIKPEDIDKLFTNYQRLDAVKKDKDGGAGLGLALARKLAVMMGGDITVKSEYGKGSEFTITLKQGYVSDDVIGQSVADALTAYSYTDQKRSSKAAVRRIKLDYARVLITDDNETNLSVAKGLMKPYQMQIDCVTSGYDAVAAIQSAEVRYNAVFMDHMMPGMDGIEAFEAIRAIDTDYARNIPIIALTANAAVGNEKMFLEKGFNDFLAKPIDTKRLDGIINRWVRDGSIEAEYTEAEDAAEQAIDISIEGIDIQGAAEALGGDKETYLSVLRSYLASTRRLLPEVETFAPENIEIYGITVHGIKGASLGIGANYVGGLAYELEKASKSGDIEFIYNNNKAFLDEAHALIGRIEQALAQIDDKNPKPKKDKPDAELLQRLAAACEEYDMDEIDAVMEEIENFAYENDGGLAAWLRENVDMMSLDEIVEKLSEQ